MGHHGGVAETLLTCFRILELASQNNVLLLERLKEQGEEAVRRAREAEDQV